MRRSQQSQFPQALQTLPQMDDYTVIHLATHAAFVFVNLVNSKVEAITPETALQRVLGIPASFWNNRERRYQEAREQLAV